VFLYRKTYGDMSCVAFCIIHCVSKKRANHSASCSFDKHRLIFIIFGKQHQHTFESDMHIQLSLSLHFYLFYLLLNSCDGNDTKQGIFLGRLLSQLCSVLALKGAGFSLADVQSDVLLPSVMRAHNRFQHLPTALTFCGMLARVSLMHCIKSLASQTCATVAKCCSRRGFQVNWTVWRTQIWKDKIRCFLIKELDCFTSISEVRKRHFRRSYLIANKISKSERTRKVEYAYHY